MNRKYAKDVHPLADESKPCGKITFIHSVDKKEHIFEWATNELSEDILAWFDHNAPTIEKGYTWIKSVIKDIYSKSDKVIKHIGDYQNA